MRLGFFAFIFSSYAYASMNITSEMNASCPIGEKMVFNQQVADAMFFVCADKDQSASLMAILPMTTAQLAMQCVGYAVASNIVLLAQTKHWHSPITSLMDRSMTWIACPTYLTDSQCYRLIPAGLMRGFIPAATISADALSRYIEETFLLGSNHTFTGRASSCLQNFGNVRLEGLSANATSLAVLKRDSMFYGCRAEEGRARLKRLMGLFVGSGAIVLVASVITFILTI